MAIKKAKYDGVPAPGKYDVREVKTPGGKIDTSNRVTLFLHQAFKQGKSTPGAKYNIDKMVTKNRTLFSKWPQMNNKEIERGSIKIAKSKMPDVGTYNPELGPTRSKILNTIVPKGKILRYHDHEVKKSKNVPGQAHYFRKDSDNFGMT